MKIVKGFIFFFYFPCIAFAIVKNTAMNELYFSPTFSLEEHFDWIDTDGMNNVFADKKPNEELHFKMLNFNGPTATQNKFSFHILPMYDFSRESEVEDYKNNLKICAYCFRLFQIKFDFF
ncbi:MAG TPA: hypothetical protein VHM20_02725 [Gammaproteobacteria bacterium]|jgi:hypothetical protein|nr:hypothetical protein [Gammaproteobacteria bacterium]